jgi:hypothetical protein
VGKVTVVEISVVEADAIVLAEKHRYLKNLCPVEKS